MAETGWTGEAPDAEAVPMPLTAQLLANGRGEEQPGGVLEYALARTAADERRAALEEAAAAPDPDERAAGLLARRYRPGLVSDLARQYADTLGELAAEEEKLERSARRQERIARDHAAGKLTGFDIMAMQDADEGDAHRAGQLRRRAGNLKQQLQDVSAMIAPVAERVPDPLEAVTSRAHEAFREATRSALAAAEAPRSAPAGSRPFASGDPGSAAAHDCPHCRGLSLTREQREQLHSEVERMMARDGYEIAR
jgi:hypothetical protein